MLPNVVLLQSLHTGASRSKFFTLWNTMLVLPARESLDDGLVNLSWFEHNLPQIHPHPLALPIVFLHQHFLLLECPFSCSLGAFFSTQLIWTTFLFFLILLPQMIFPRHRSLPVSFIFLTPLSYFSSHNKINIIILVFFPSSFPFFQAQCLPAPSFSHSFFFLSQFKKKKNFLLILYDFYTMHPNPWSPCPFIPALCPYNSPPQKK